MTGTQFGSSFLTDPDAFPVSVEGRLWGDRERVLDLPGGPFVISGLSAPQAALVDREYASVIMPEPRSRNDTVQTSVYRATSSLLREVDYEGWTYTLDLDSTEDRLRLAAMQFAALVPWNRGAAAGVWTSVEDRWFQGVIENYLRVVVAHRLLLRGGLLLHSAGVVVDGSAVLFVGASGAGKSTLARKAFEAGNAVLSDDLNAVVDLSAAPTVSQLPFTGDLRDQSTVEGTIPVGGLFVLNKGSDVGRDELSRAEAVASIVATAPFVNRGGHNLQRLVDSATGLAERVPVARLTTARETRFDKIEEAVLGFQVAP
jgi:hypothetical protein